MADAKTNAHFITGKHHSPLLHEGWLEFNCRKQSLTPLRMKVGRMCDASPEVETVLYLNRSGQLVLPHLNPYIPVITRWDSSTRSSTRGQRWLDLASEIAGEMRTRRIRGQLALAPEVTDARPFSWAGFQVGLKYTYVLQLPFNTSMVDSGVRRNIVKAQRAGYVCDRAKNFKDVELCLRETEERQAFSYGITAHDLAELQTLLGTECLRVYVAYSPNGEPASARVILWTAGAMAIDWLVGTMRAHLYTGATQLLLKEALSDLERSGALRFDFEGANIPSIAASKIRWGATLVPYPVLESNTIRNWLIQGARVARAALQMKAISPAGPASNGTGGHR